MSTAKTVKYYNKFGSRVGYNLVAGGHRHFGYNEEKKYWYIPNACVAMIDYLAKYAGIKSGESVLDAGCGEGKTALRIAENTGAKVTGIDLVPRSIEIAKASARKSSAKTDYLIADYNDIPFKDETFDVVYTLETFTHTSDPEKTIKELLRVLRPGGRLVIFDYTIQELSKAPPNIAEVIHDIAKGTDCPGFEIIDHDYYDRTLPKMGIVNYEMINKTNAVLRTLKQMYYLSWLPYWIIKIAGQVHKHPNMLISHFGLRNAEAGYWRYVNVKIIKD